MITKLYLSLCRAIAVSDFTEHGTYIASFTLENLYASMVCFIYQCTLRKVFSHSKHPVLINIQLDNQEHAPSSLEFTLEWLSHAFGSSQLVIWQPENPYLLATHSIKIVSTELTQVIRLPPDGCTFINHLSHNEAHRVYHQIVSSLYHAWSGVQQKLKECEEKKQEFTRAMHAQIVLDSENDKKRADIFAILDSVNGVAKAQSSKSSDKPPSSRVHAGPSTENDTPTTGRSSPMLVRRKNIVRPIRQLSQRTVPMGIQKKKG